MALERQQSVGLVVFALFSIVIGIAEYGDATGFIRFTEKYKPVADFFSAFAAPLIAVIIAYIAWQQHLTNSHRLNLDRYDRQLKIFRAVLVFTRDIYESSSVEVDALNKFLEVHGESHFIFEGNEIHEYILELHDKGLQLYNSKSEKSSKKLCKYFGEQTGTGAKDVFMTYLKL